MKEASRTTGMWPVPSSKRHPQSKKQQTASIKEPRCGVTYISLGKNSAKHKQFGPFCLNGIITWCSQCEPSFRKGEAPVLGLRSLLQVRCS